MTGTQIAHLVLGQRIIYDGSQGTPKNDHNPVWEVVSVKGQLALRHVPDAYSNSTCVYFLSKLPPFAFDNAFQPELVLCEVEEW